MKGVSIFFAALIGLSLFPLGARASAVDDLLARYRKEGAGPMSAQAGEALWKKTFSESGEARSCGSCHTADLRAVGKHAATGKAIDPMAPSVNSKRLTDAALIEKWLKRNCKWTLGRECDPAEKGSLLLYLQGR